MRVRSEVLEVDEREENTTKWSGYERGRRKGKETGGRGAMKEELSM